VGTQIDRSGGVWADIQRIRERAPLVHNITNYVVMNTTANALLALGASPVMAHAEEEVAEMSAIAGALVLNIGTLSPAWITAMFRAGETARARGVPIVLDPVGAGATTLRTSTARRLFEELRPAVTRGNASEIRALAIDERGTKGVDSAHGPEAAMGAADELAARYGGVVVVSGAVDVVRSGARTSRVRNGAAIMTRVTGMGCSATALIGAFAAVNPSAHDASANAMATMGIAGEMAAEQARGPGSFLPLFLDALASLDEAGIRERLRMEEA
jgi:hydroxyethylthiazole kinase